VEHSEGKGGESDVAILRFLCGSPHPCRLRAPRASLELCTDHMSGFLGSDKLSSFVTTLSNRTSPLHVVLLLLEGERGRGCNTPATPCLAVVTPGSPLGS
jgi:hypothetical protein